MLYLHDLSDLASEGLVQVRRDTVLLRNYSFGKITENYGYCWITADYGRLWQIAADYHSLPQITTDYDVSMCFIMFHRISSRFIVFYGILSAKMSGLAKWNFVELGLPNRTKTLQKVTSKGAKLQDSPL